MSLPNALLVPLCFGLLFVWAGCSADATSVPAGKDTWATTITGPGTYTLAAGTHTLTTTVSIPPGVTITAESGATVVLGNATIQLQSDDVLKGLSISSGASTTRMIALVAAANNAYQHDVTLQNCTLIGTGATQGFGASQGFNSYHRNINVLENTFKGATVYVEIGSNFNISKNTFEGLTKSGAAIHLSEVGNSTISGNRIDGGQTGIIFLARDDIGTFHVEPMNNAITNNIITNVREEGISFDENGNNPAATRVREYDTIAAIPGSNSVTLASAKWGSRGTYTGSRYHLSFLTGALAGKYYVIKTHSGASVTLAIPADDYAKIATGDGITISTLTANNVEAHNTVVKNVGTAIMFWGGGNGNTVVNNIVQTIGPYSDKALIFGTLNGISSATSLSGNPRRMASVNNVFTHNLVFAGAVDGAFYLNYNKGDVPNFTPVSNTVVSTTTGDPLFVSAATNDFHLSANSPAIDAGIATTARTTDYYGNPIYGAPDLGSIEYQPPYRIGVDAINPTGSVRIYADGKYRYTLAPTTAPGMDFSVKPASGAFPSFTATAPRPLWVDIAKITWNRSGTYSKAWTATGYSAGATVFTVGNLQPGVAYAVAVDGVTVHTVTADSNGRAAVTYTVGSATHKFAVSPAG